MTRAQIADPDLVAKLAVGRPSAIRPCIRCNQTCQVRDARNPIVTCVGEPSSGHESEDPGLVRARARRRAPCSVVGGGPAGLETARVAAARGHDVRLVERDARSAAWPPSPARRPAGGVAGRRVPAPRRQHRDGRRRGETAGAAEAAPSCSAPAAAPARGDYDVRRGAVVARRPRRAPRHRRRPGRGHRRAVRSHRRADRRGPGRGAGRPGRAHHPGPDRRQRAVPHRRPGPGQRPPPAARRPDRAPIPAAGGAAPARSSWRTASPAPAASSPPPPSSTAATASPTTIGRAPPPGPATASPPGRCWKPSSRVAAPRLASTDVG